MKKVYSKIESINGSVITVKAEDVTYGELAEVQTRFGTSLAEVNKLDNGLVSLQVFAGGRGVSTGDEVRFLGKEMQISFSDDLLGRIFNGSGTPRDAGPSLQENMIPIGGPSFQTYFGKTDDQNRYSDDRRFQYPRRFPKIAHFFKLRRTV